MQWSMSLKYEPSSEPQVPHSPAASEAGASARAAGQAGDGRRDRDFDQNGQTRTGQTRDRRASYLGDSSGAGGTPYTLHPTPCTLHPTPYTLHPTPHTRNTKHETRNTKYETQNRKHEIRNLKHEIRNACGQEGVGRACGKAGAPIYSRNLTEYVMIYAMLSLGCRPEVAFFSSYTGILGDI